MRQTYIARLALAKGLCMQRDDAFTPKLTTADWAAEWIVLQEARHAADNAEHWNERSKTYNKSSTPNDYVKKFLEFADVKPGESVFDMGCGTGAITIPLAKEGHSVIAADFSKGMLGILEDEARACKLSGIKTILMSWSDDWEKHGVPAKSVDVACASRSIATADLKESLSKLSNIAKRRCCITLPTGSSPRTDERVLSAIGVENLLGRDFIYAFMILTQMGYLPEVRYIPSTRIESYADEEEAYASLSKMVIDASSRMLSKEAVSESLMRLRTWLKDNLIANPKAGQVNIHGETEGALVLKESRKVTWGFISWDVNRLR